MKEPAARICPILRCRSPKGLHLVLYLDESADDRAICERTAAKGLAVSPLSHCYLQPSGMRGLVLGIGRIPERMVEPVVRRLAETMRQLVEQSARLSACGILFD